MAACAFVRPVAGGRWPSSQRQLAFTRHRANHRQGSAFQSSPHAQTAQPAPAPPPRRPVPPRMRMRHRATGVRGRTILYLSLSYFNI